MNSQSSVTPYLNLKAHHIDVALHYARCLLRDMYNVETAVRARQGRLFTDDALRERLLLWQLLGLSLDQRPSLEWCQDEITRAISALEKRLEESSMYVELETRTLS